MARRRRGREGRRGSGGGFLALGGGGETRHAAVAELDSAKVDGDLRIVGRGGGVRDGDDRRLDVDVDEDILVAREGVLRLQLEAPLDLVEAPSVGRGQD